MTIDFTNGTITSVSYEGTEILAKPSPLFTIRLRGKAGDTLEICAKDCTLVENTENKGKYSYQNMLEIDISFVEKEDIRWKIDLTNNSKYLIEWIDYPTPIVKPLVANGGTGRVLFPYNEGYIAEDINKKNTIEPEYPSQGNYSIFPNMVFSQFLCYLFEGKGLYIGSEDTKRGVKYIDFRKESEINISLYYRIYCGGNYGDDYKAEYPVIWRFFQGDWQDGADIYRNWLYENLPNGMKKIPENEKLPSWYEDSPVIITYPVRGVHDMDRMEPNKLFPYINGKKYVEEIAKATESKLLVLLMHWEGTAPWAPPKVWPPYGGEEIFNEFKDYLHDNGHSIGVYCSGFGWTLRSNLIPTYDKTEELAETSISKGFTKGPGNKLRISKICTGQRIGYDLCVKTKVAKEVLWESYVPLFKAGIDYAQILDQNHGGGQYFCYAEDHGHPPCPGEWMTEEMQGILESWQNEAGKMIFGCESAAAEPFIPNLLFSDNRYQLNFLSGHVVPLYAYLFHEFLRNFSGNQVCGFFSDNSSSVEMRLAYSFTAGDAMTLILTPDGEINPNWGNRDFSNPPNKEKVLGFVRTLQDFYKNEVKDYLYCGKMIKPLPYSCKYNEYLFEGQKVYVESVFSTAWEYDRKRIQIFVNYNVEDEEIIVDGKKTVIPGLSAMKVNLNLA